MKVLIYPHDLGMGGSQLNAIELAARVRDLGAETMIFGRPGVLCERIEELGLEFIESPDPGRRPSIKIARELRSIAKARRINVLHGYEWPPSLECYAAAALMPDTRAISTVMSMSVPPFIPTTVPLLVGTEQICAHERARGRNRIHVLEPPVDLTHNVPSTGSEVAALRRRWEVADDRPLLVCVSRLANELKSEGLLSAIAAVAGPLDDLGVQLMIVGDGPAREKIEQAAAAANASTTGSVIMTGELADPRPAYTAADIVLGMGGSALRALAFAKPLVVQGEKGFFELLDEKSWRRFAWQGWYGVGSDSQDGVANFASILRPLLADKIHQNVLSDFGARLVRARFSLEAAAERQLDVYEQSLREAPSSAAAAVSFTTSVQRFSIYYARRKVARLLGQRRAEDFNAQPVAADTSTSNRSSRTMNTYRGALVYLAGAPWHAVTGTDVQLARAMGKHRPVIWVDPPVSIISRIRRGLHVPPVSEVAPGVTRLHTIAPPGVTRPGVRTISRWWSHALVQHYIRRSGRTIDAVLTSSPEPVLTPWRNRAVRRLYFATDDFVAGAALMGISARYAARARRRNLAVADSVLAVTENLAVKLREYHNRVLVFPNGCNPQIYEGLSKVAPSGAIQLPSPVAGVVGQFNARLDVDCLAAVAATGASLLLVGPRYDRDANFSRRFSELITLPNVQWIDRRPLHEMPSFMAALKVGLTPYSDTEFNRASFPLKTLEYLSAGIAVVSTELPATHTLDQKLLSVAQSPAAFAAATCNALREPSNYTASLQRREYAQRHSWEARAAQLTNIIWG
jgi:glycosyltransferase involved in cell wall biosynthesis